jgi:hypothetical protein
VRLTDDEVEVLAEIYADKSRALVLLEQATKIGRARLPLNALAPLVFWTEVNELVESGALPDGRQRILERAAAENEGNPFLQNAATAARAEGLSNAATPAGARRRVEISPDESRRHVELLIEAGCTSIPIHWGVAELEGIQAQLNAQRGSPGAEHDLIREATAKVEWLVRALRARELLEEHTAVKDVSSGELAHLFWRSRAGEREPGASLERLLVLAASTPPSDDLKPSSALARFVVSILGHLRASLDQAWVADWLSWRENAQLRDAKDYLASEERWWLLVDLGPDPRSTAVHWWLYTPDNPLHPKSGEESVIDGLTAADRFVAALGKIMNQMWKLRVGPNLMIDVAVPAELITDGVEHWRLRLPGGSRPFALNGRFQPRLRYSPRLYEPDDSGWLAADRRVWARDPMVLDRSVVSDGGRTAQWINDHVDADYPYLVADASVDPRQVVDIVEAAPRFIIWLRSEADSVSRRIRDVARQNEPDLRRLSLPELIDDDDRKMVTVLWDPPEGRGKYSIAHLTTSLPGTTP